MTRPRTRIAIAGLLVAAALGVPLAFVWVSGEAAAQAEHDRILAAPELSARAAAERIARRVSAELEELAAREGARPYYQWQSLIVDPRGAYEGEAVVPSPLAGGPTEPLVLAHFQLDGAGHATSPEVNEAKGAPPSSPDALARLAVIRAALGGRRAEPVQTAKVQELVQYANGEPVQQHIEPLQEVEQQQVEPVQQGNVVEEEVPQQVADASDRIQEQRVSNRVYQLNASAPELFEAIQQKKSRKQAFAPGQVTVKVGAFEWETLALATREVVAATRPVETPDGILRQGFVVDPQRLATLLSDGAVLARLAPSGGDLAGVAMPLALPGLGRSVVVALPEPATIAAAAAVPIDEQRVRSLVLTLFALVAAAAILALVIQAERLLERRQRFAAAAAHELRTPLAGLRMYAEMLAHGLGKPEKQKAYAERLASEAARLGRVVSNVLDFTRLERKSLAVSPVAQDLAAIVEELVKQLEPSLAAAGAKLVCERPAGPLTARVDGDALAQILGNLIDNAEKYTRTASDRTITVTVAEGAQGPEVRVRDRGPGLGDPKRLFRPFARGAPKDGPAGLGLGLALARALAQAQGGDLVAAEARDGAELVVRCARVPG